MTATSADTRAKPAGVMETFSWDDRAHQLFLAHSQKAAVLERGGEYYQASEVWGECRVLAATSVERFWCEVRQKRCLKQVSGVNPNPVRRRVRQP